MSDNSSSGEASSEQGIVYYYADPKGIDDEAKARVYAIGVKRYGGCYCTNCSLPLGLATSRKAKVERDLRKAEKNDANIVQTCATCKATIGSGVIPCTTFDWHMQPNLLERVTGKASYVPTTQKSPAATQKDAESDSSADMQADSGRSNRASKLPLKRISMRGSAVLSAGGKIFDNYGQQIAFDDFWNNVVGNTLVRYYDCIPKA